MICGRGKSRLSQMLCYLNRSHAMSCGKVQSWAGPSPPQVPTPLHYVTKYGLITTQAENSGFGAFVLNWLSISDSLQSSEHRIVYLKAYGCRPLNSLLEIWCKGPAKACYILWLRVAVVSLLHAKLADNSSLLAFPAELDLSGADQELRNGLWWLWRPWSTHLLQRFPLCKQDLGKLESHLACLVSSPDQQSTAPGPPSPTVISEDFIQSQWASFSSCLTSEDGFVLAHPPQPSQGGPSILGGLPELSSNLCTIQWDAWTFKGCPWISILILGLPWAQNKILATLDTSPWKAKFSVNIKCSFVYATLLPPRVEMHKEYGEQLVACGLVGAAMEVFEKLELWDNLLVCYSLLEKVPQALALVRRRLEVCFGPSDPHSQGQATQCQFDCHACCDAQCLCKFLPQCFILRTSMYSLCKILLQDWLHEAALCSVPFCWFHAPVCPASRTYCKHNFISYSIPDSPRLVTLSI